MDGIICVNKKQNMTSFDVLRLLRRKYRVKLGHSGTLDPNATGLLLIAVGKATKALNYIEAKDKTYIATCQLGLKTDTGDIWGETIMTTQESRIDEIKLKTALRSFIGPQSQRVPMVSAKKIDGKKLYEYHREKIEVETQYTDIEVYDIKLLEVTESSFSFSASVSNGTYIRTLCEDIAESMGQIGTMSSLVRSQIGKYTLEDALDLDHFPEVLDPIPTKEAICLRKIYDEELEFKIKNGQRILLDIEEDEVLLDSGEYFAVYKREKENQFKSVRGLW